MFFLFWTSVGTRRAIQDTVYTSVHEDTLRSAVRASKAPEDAMDMGSLATAVSIVDEAIKEEQQHQSDSDKRSLPSDGQASEAQEKLALERLEITATELMLRKIIVSSGDAVVADEKKELVQSYEEKAKRLVEANIVVVPIPNSEKKTREALQGSAAGKARGKDGKHYVGVFLDQGLFGEPVTAPHVRINAVNQTVTKVGHPQANTSTYNMLQVSVP